MKLPGIDYRTQVRGAHGRIDVGQVGRVAAAKASIEKEAIRKIAEPIEGIEENIYNQNAVSEYNRASSEYKTRVDKARQEMTANPYREEPIDPEDPESETRLVSRFRDLGREFEQAERDIFKSVSGSLINKKAANKFISDATGWGLRAKSDINATAVEWQREDARMTTFGTIKDSVRSGDFDGATTAYKQAAVTGLLSEEELRRIPLQIAGHQQHHRASAVIDAVSTSDQSVAVGSALRDPQNYPDLTDTQRKSLQGKLNDKLESTSTSALRAVIETSGIEKGKDFVHAINRTPYEKLGFVTDEDKRKAIDTLQGVVEDYRRWNSEKKEKAGFNKRLIEVQAGAPTDPKSSLDKKVMDATFQAATDDAPRFSPEYNTQALWHANKQGWVPPQVQSDMRAYLHADSPEEVMQAASLVSDIRRTYPRALFQEDAIDENGIAFALTIDQMSQSGALPMETIKNIREGIYNVPESHRKQRGEKFDREIGKDSEVHLGEMIADDENSNPFWKLTAEHPPEMAAEFKGLYRMHYIRTGNKDVAAKQAHDSLRRVWGVTDAYGSRLQMERFSPEAIVGNGNPEEWITSQWNKDMADIGVEPENVYRVFDTNAPEAKRWLLFNRETNDLMVTPDGKIRTWSPDRATSPHTIAEQKKAAKHRENVEITRQRRIDAEKARSDIFIYGEPAVDIPEETRKAVGIMGELIDDRAVKLWEFALDTVPGVWDKMPHKREWAKKARGE
jgi:hypothetical protein